MKSLFQFTTLFAVLLHPISAETVSGRVVDPSGAAINRATVTITSREGEVRRSIQTAGTGEYHFDGLNAGEYLIEAKAPGFGSNRATTLTIATGRGATADLQLDLTKLTTQYYHISMKNQRKNLSARVTTFTIKNLDGLRLLLIRRYACMELLMIAVL